MTRVVLLSGAAFCALQTPAYAYQTATGISVEEPATPDEDSGTEIVVTGSRIARPEYDGNIPGGQMAKEEIEDRGIISAIDTANELPFVSTGATIEGENGGGSSLGVAFVDVLGLGSQRTLGLVNGRRMVSGNSAAFFTFGNEAGSQINFSVLPSQMIARTDVLTVGGAAAYGSDAVAGVVNVILRDKYVGTEGVLRYSQIGEGPGKGGFGSLIHGTGFASGRGNLVVAVEYNNQDALSGFELPYFMGAAQQVGNYARARNPDFTGTEAVDINVANNGAFLRTFDDGLPTTVYGRYLGMGHVTDGGSVFLRTPTTGQLIPGEPVTSPAGTTSTTGFFTRWAPTALPAGTNCATVLQSFGLTRPDGLTLGQCNTLALNVLQANRPTPREYFAEHPETDINLFLGTFDKGFLTVANTDAATRDMFPRRAVPLRFDDSGKLVEYRVASLDPTTPSTLALAAGTEGVVNRKYNTLRIRQERIQANLIASFDISDNVRFFTQNLYSRVRSERPFEAASPNTGGTTENSILSFTLDHPFLSQENRSLLQSLGVTANQTLRMTRSNQDLEGSTPMVGTVETISSVAGVEGSMDLFGRKFDWETSASYGRSTGTTTSSSILDAQYALAADVVLDANGRAVCRAQTNPAAYLGKSFGVASGIDQVAAADNPLGFVTDAFAVARPGADGIPQLAQYSTVITRQMIDDCSPLNLFGEGQSSREARDYVLGTQELHQRNEQLFLQGYLSGSLFDLPGGPVGVSVAAEYRKEKFAFSTDQISATGGFRNAAATIGTRGQSTAYEYGIEFRIPVIGKDLTLPLVENFDISPAIRISKQDASAPDYRNLDGDLIERNIKGDTATIWSLAATYKPFRDLTIRGNMTRSIRQPALVEYFLSGQQASNSASDPCSLSYITAGNAANRQANCLAQLQATGDFATAADAQTFLDNYNVQLTQARTMRYGNADLAPERGKSWTIGAAYQPGFIPGLTLGGDYINLTIHDAITRVTFQQAADLCYDSPDFPTDPLNLCQGLRRNTAGLAPDEEGYFRFANRVDVLYVNLGAVRVRSLNLNGRYTANLSELLGSRKPLGRINLSAAAYKVFEFSESGSGNFDDATELVGTLAAPDWRVRANIVWSLRPFSLGWTFNWVSPTVYKTGGLPNTIEQFSVISTPAYSVHDLMLRYSVDRRITAQVNIYNAFNRRFINEDNGTLYQGGRGRTFALTLRGKF
jgi:outer membrane receptor protein involved in Fe transport